MVKQNKITTKTSEFFSIIEKKVKDGKYVFTYHAEQRGVQRQVLDEEVLNILKISPDILGPG